MTKTITRIALAATALLGLAGTSAPALAGDHHVRFSVQLAPAYPVYPYYPSQYYVYPSGTVYQQVIIQNPAPQPRQAHTFGKTWRRR